MEFERKGKTKTFYVIVYGCVFELQGILVLASLLKYLSISGMEKWRPFANIRCWKQNLFVGKDFWKSLRMLSIPLI